MAGGLQDVAEPSISLESVPVPSSFCDPMTLDIMQDPVRTVDGHVYERRAIEQWFRSGKRTSPLTGADLPSLSIVADAPMQRAIQEYVAMRPELARPRTECQSLQAAALALQVDLLSKDHRLQDALEAERCKVRALQAELDHARVLISQEQATSAELRKKLAKEKASSADAKHQKQIVQNACKQAREILADAEADAGGEAHYVDEVPDKSHKRRRLIRDCALTPAVAVPMHGAPDASERPEGEQTAIIRPEMAKQQLKRQTVRPDPGPAAPSSSSNSSDPKRFCGRIGMRATLVHLKENAELSGSHVVLAAWLR